MFSKPFFIGILFFIALFSISLNGFSDLRKRGQTRPSSPTSGQSSGEQAYTCNEDRQGGRTNLPDRIWFQSVTEAIRFYEFALNKTIYLRVRFHNNLPHSSYYIGE